MMMDAFIVREMPKAKEDKQQIVVWHSGKSAAGALAWLDAYDAMIGRLRNDPFLFSHAPERQDCGRDLRQVLFRTKRGRIYRALFIVFHDVVHIMRVRAPGQSAVDPHDLA